MNSLRLFLSLCLVLPFLFGGMPAAIAAPSDTPENKNPQTDEPSSAEEKTETPAPVAWGKIESIGTLSSAKQGALEKSLWKDQPRSAIESLMETLPTEGGSHAAVNLQRRLLLSRVDAGMIENDVGPLRGNDLLIRRINKLIGMGLYDDAWELYTQIAEEDPYDVSIAQTGMLLLVMRDDLATACLEEKVLAEKFPTDNFFRILDAACARTLGMAGSNPAAFEGSPTLKSLYADETFSIPASDWARLLNLNPLERALLLANNRIRYDGLSESQIPKIPSMLLGLYLMDETLPEAARALIGSEMSRRGLGWHIVSVAKASPYKKASDLSKDKEGQWPVLESAINMYALPGERAIFAPLLVDAVPPQNLSTESLVKILGAFLAAQQAPSDNWLDLARKAAPQKPIIYIYLQAFESLTSLKESGVKEEDFIKAMAALSPADSDQILAIIESLDKDINFLKVAERIYEKHSRLTLQGSYVMPLLGLNVLLETAPEKKQIGITVLAVLNALAATPDNMYSGTVRKALYGLLNVGLIEDAKAIGADTVASVLNKY